MNFKNFSFEYKLANDGSTFEGYASTFGNRDLVGDVVVKGAFADTIQEKLPKNQIKVLWQHDPSSPIGKPIHLEEDSKGLFSKFKISDTPKGKEAIALMKDGVIDTLSIGYEVKKDSLSEDGQSRFLEKISLFEFSVVTFPANPEATISPLKSLLNEIKEGRALSQSRRSKLEAILAELQEILNTDSGKNEDEKDLDIFADLLSDMKSYELKK